MTVPPGVGGPTPREPADQPAFAPLAGSLQLAGGFTLLPVNCNQQAVQLRLIEQLQAAVGPDRLRHVHLSKPTDDLLADLVARVDPAYLGAVAVTGLETHLRAEGHPEVSRAVINLNHFRDRYPRQFPRPLVLIVPSYLLSAIARGAPDFFSVHSGVFHFEPELGLVRHAVEEQTWGGISAWDGMVPDRRWVHVAELQNLLRELRARPVDHQDVGSEIQVLLALASQFEAAGGQYAQAVSYAEQADRISEGVADRFPVARSTALNNLASLLQQVGNLTGALRKYRQAAAANPAANAATQNNIGSVLLEQGDLAGALTAFREAESIARAALGGEHTCVAASLSNIALVHHRTGNLAAALANLREAERIDRAHFGDLHPEVATDLNNIGAILEAQGDMDAALRMYRDSEQMSRAFFGPDHPSVATSLNNLGLLLHARGDVAGAREACREAFVILARTCGIKAAPTLTCAVNIIGLGEDPVALTAEAVGTEAATELEDELLRRAANTTCTYEPGAGDTPSLAD